MKTGVWKRSARSKACTAKSKHSAGLEGNKQDVLGVAVRSVRAGEDVSLLRAGGHAGGRPGALDVDDDRRDLGVVGEADELVHQRDAGAGGGGEGARTVPAGADDHADRGKLVFGLHDAVVVLPVPGPCGTSRRSCLKASITEVRA